MLALKYGEFEIARFICSWTYLSGRMFCADVNFSLWYGKWHIEVKRKKTLYFLTELEQKLAETQQKLDQEQVQFVFCPLSFVKN